MGLISCLVASSYIASFASASAFPSSSSSPAEGSFIVNVGAGSPRLTGPAGLRATLLKYGRTVPADVEAAANDPSILIDAYKKLLTPSELARLDDESSSVPVTGHIEHDYIVPITIGKSQLELLVDTGSSDLWVYSDLLPKNETGGHHLYDNSTGTLLKDYSWKITYGEGTSAAGIVYHDTAHIGGATATSQAIEAATAISSPNAFGKNSDGILGLAFKKLNSVKPKHQSPFWANLNAPQNEKIFAVDFQYPTGGTLGFGSVDPSKYNGSITYTPAFGPYWGFNYTEFAVGNTTYTPIGYPKGHIGEGIIDTGTSFMLLTYLAAHSYWKQVEGAKKVGNHYVLPCSSKTTDFGIQIGGKYFYADKAALKHRLGDGICYGGIQAEFYTKYETGDIIGLPFILGNYVVFEGEVPRIGFAEKK